MNSVHEVTGKCSLPVSNHFPPEVRDALVIAAQTHTPEWNPLARVKAINRAITWSRSKYPELFRPSEVFA